MERGLLLMVSANSPMENKQVKWNSGNYVELAAV
jgi:hypothetical protein